MGVDPRPCPYPGGMKNWHIATVAFLALVAVIVIARGSHRDTRTTTPPETGKAPAAAEGQGSLDMTKIEKTDAEWREQLTPEQYHITREAGTERAGTGAYLHTKIPGVYKCVCCDLPLFSSDGKFDSGCGWPAFFEAYDGFHVTELEDTSYGMVRTEVRCKRCDAHLGHVFDDGPRDKGGRRYCINSLAIVLDPDAEPGKKDARGDSTRETRDEK